MKYEHQINWANACYNNLDNGSKRLLQNGLIYVIYTSTSNLSERMANSEGCTSYDRKNRTNSYNFLRIKRVHVLDSSVSFKPTSVDFAIVLHMLSFWQF